MKQFGQFLILGFKGTRVSDEIRYLIQKLNIAGIVLFTRNFESKAQLIDLCASLQEIKQRVSQKSLLICADYEGGFVVRFNAELSLLPSAASQAIAGTKEITKALYHYNASTLNQIGINVNFAPVLDIPQGENPFIGIRSFSEKPEVVKEFGLAAMNGIHSGGLLACGKHFPGIGKASGDSHFVMPIIKGNKEEFLKHDLLPYLSLFKKGLPLVMTSHCSYPEIDPSQLPATFSTVINTDILRKALNFQGVLISDDLCMKALSGWDLCQSSLLAFNSGVDLLMVCHEPLLAEKIADYLETCKSRGEISSERIKEAEERINQLEKSLMKIQEKPPPPLKPLKDIELILGEIASKTLTSLKLSAPAFQRSDKIVIMASESFSANSAEDEPFLETFFKEIKELFPASRLLSLKEKEKELGIEKGEKIIFLGVNVSVDPLQQKVIRDLHESGLEIMLSICVKNPSDAPILLSCSQNLILSYGFQPHNIKALIHFIRNRLLF